MCVCLVSDLFSLFWVPLVHLDVLLLALFLTFAVFFWSPAVPLLVIRLSRTIAASRGGVCSGIDSARELSSSVNDCVCGLHRITVSEIDCVCGLHCFAVPPTGGYELVGHRLELYGVPLAAHDPALAKKKEIPQ